MRRVEPDVAGRTNTNGLSRRQMLQRTAAAGAAVPLAHALINGDADAQGQTPLPAFAASSPTFSLAERNRRWGAIRANMAKPGWNLDAIITPCSDGVGNNARYLTQIFVQRVTQPTPEVLFPRDPAKTVFVQVSSGRHVEEWGRRLGPGGWLSDGKMVLEAESGAAALAKRLTAEGFNRPGTRLGVAKLKGSRFDPDGLASATWLDTLKAALPAVLFLPIDQFPPKAGNDAGPIEEASMSKSAEEIAMIRKSVAVTERAIMAAAAAARNGATRQADLWWACYQVQYTSTGEEPIRCSIACDVSSANALLGDPTDVPVRPGQICVQETTTSYQGYGCQINHPFFIGSRSTPGYQYYRATVELLAKAIERAIAFIQPGKTIGEFQANNEKIFKELGEKGTGLNVHGSGIGYLSRPRQSEGDNLLVMQPGFAFDFKPGVALDRAKIRDVGEKNRSVYMGEAILVTDKGAERLSTRPLVPIATHG